MIVRSQETGGRLLHVLRRFPSFVLIGLISFIAITSLYSGIASAQSVQKIRIGVLKTASNAPFYIAEAEGFYEDEGLQVELTSLGGGAELIPAVEGRSLQFTASNTVSVLLAINNGFDLVMVAGSTLSTLEAPDNIALMTLKDMGYTSLADLEGKRVATNNINNIIWLMGMKAFENNGVRTDTIRWAEVPYPQMGDALLNASVDAAIIAEPFVTSLMRSDLSDLFNILAYPALKVESGMMINQLISSRHYSENNPDVVERVNRAYRRAVEFIQEHPDLAIEHIASFSGIDRELAAEMVLPLWTPAIEVEKVQSIYDLMLEYGLIDRQRVKPADIIHEVAL